MHLVYEYTGLSFNDIMALDVITFKALLRDAFINRMRKSEEGREYLENCWLMKQTEPDRRKLRREFKEN